MVGGRGLARPGSPKLEATLFCASRAARRCAQHGCRSPPAALRARAPPPPASHRDQAARLPPRGRSPPAGPRSTARLCGWRFPVAAVPLRQRLRTARGRRAVGGGPGEFIASQRARVMGLPDWPGAVWSRRRWAGAGAGGPRNFWSRWAGAVGPGAHPPGGVRERALAARRPVTPAGTTAETGETGGRACMHRQRRPAAWRLGIPDSEHTGRREEAARARHKASASVPAAGACTARVTRRVAGGRACACTLLYVLHTARVRDYPQPHPIRGARARGGGAPRLGRCAMRAAVRARFHCVLAHSART